MLKRNPHESSPRLYGYVTQKSKSYWLHEQRRVAKMEGLRKPGMGTLFDRAALYGLRFDQGSLQRYVETHKLTNGNGDAPPKPGGARKK